jgi:hypothetical protein
MQSPATDQPPRDRRWLTMPHACAATTSHDLRTTPRAVDALVLDGHLRNAPGPPPTGHTRLGEHPSGVVRCSPAAGVRDGAVEQARHARPKRRWTMKHDGPDVAAPSSSGSRRSSGEVTRRGTGRGARLRPIRRARRPPRPARQAPARRPRTRPAASPAAARPGWPRSPCRAAGTTGTSTDADRRGCRRQSPRRASRRR